MKNIPVSQSAARNMRAAAFQHTRINQLVVQLEDGWVRPVGVQEREDSRVIHGDLVNQALLANLIPKPKLRTLAQAIVRHRHSTIKMLFRCSH